MQHIGCSFYAVVFFVHSLVISKSTKAGSHALSLSFLLLLMMIILMIIACVYMCVSEKTHMLHVCDALDKHSDSSKHVVFYTRLKHVNWSESSTIK